MVLSTSVCVCVCVFHETARMMGKSDVIANETRWRSWITHINRENKSGSKAKRCSRILSNALHISLAAFTAADAHT